MSVVINNCQLNNGEAESNCTEVEEPVKQEIKDVLEDSSNPKTCTDRNIDKAVEDVEVVVDEENEKYINGNTEITEINDSIVSKSINNFIKKLDKQLTPNGDTDSKPFRCPVCYKQFKYNSSRYNHIKKLHRLPMEFGVVRCLEKGCTFSCSYTSVLQKHLTVSHNIPMDFSHLEFDSFKEFENWQHVYEKEESCRFVKRSGCRKGNGKTCSYLYCSRSGIFVSRSKGKKRMKKLGSCKISGHCTAAIKYSTSSEGKIKVVLCSTHYGHQKDCRYLRLTKSDRKSVLDKIKQGMPKDILLDTVRLNQTDKPDKIHFLSRKDLANMERANKILHLGRLQVTKYIDKWVERMSYSEEGSPVLYYKGRNQHNELLNELDECIVLMTPGQSDVCSVLCENGLMYATVLLLPHLGNFYLTSLLLVDEFRSTFPIAFMIGNRRDENAMQLFFKSLKEKKGQINLKAFITDNLEYIFNAWCNVMGTVSHHVWANRYVDEEWRDYLSVIADEQLQVSVYDQIYKFIEFSDDFYKTEISKLVESLCLDGESCVFGDYMKDYFLDNAPLWATCYLKDKLGFNEPINFDLTYNKIRDAFEYGNLKYMKYISRTAQALIKLMVDFHVERNNKIRAVVDEIKKMHDLSITTGDILTVFPFSKGTWKIAGPSTSSNPVEPETVLRGSCNFSENCNLRCEKCEICSHSLKCSCFNFANSFTCVHIHMVPTLWKMHDIDASNNKPVILDYNQALLPNFNEEAKNEEIMANRNDVMNNESNQAVLPNCDQEVKNQEVTADQNDVINNEASVTDHNKEINANLIIECSSEDKIQRNLNASINEIKNLKIIKKRSTRLTLKNRILSKLNLAQNLILNLRHNNSLIEAQKNANNLFRKIKIISKTDGHVRQFHKMQLVNHAKYGKEIQNLQSVNKNIELEENLSIESDQIVNFDLENTLIKPQKTEIIESIVEDNNTDFEKNNAESGEGINCEIKTQNSQTESIKKKTGNDKVVEQLATNCALELNVKHTQIPKNPVAEPNVANNSKWNRPEIPLRTYSKRKMQFDNDNELGLEENLEEQTDEQNVSLEYPRGNIGNRIITRSYLHPKKSKKRVH